MIKRLMLITLLILIIVGFLFINYVDYKLDVEVCCENYRLYKIIPAQVGGECHAWNFAQHLIGIRQCSVEQTGETIE